MLLDNPKSRAIIGGVPKGKIYFMNFAEKNSAIKIGNIFNSQVMIIHF